MDPLSAPIGSVGKLRTSDPDWEAIRCQFINGHMSLAELAQCHNLNASTMRTRAQRGRWWAAREKVCADASRAAQRRLTSNRAHELENFARIDLEIATGVQEAILARLEEATSDMGGGMSGAGLTPQDLRSLMSAAAIAQKVGRLALGADQKVAGHVANQTVSQEPSLRELIMQDVAEVLLLRKYEGGTRYVCDEDLT